MSDIPMRAVFRQFHELVMWPRVCTDDVTTANDSTRPRGCDKDACYRLSLLFNIFFAAAIDTTGCAED